MSTSFIRSIRIMQESVFGSLSATTNLPDVAATFDGTGLVFEINRADLITAGEQPSNPRDDIRGGFHGVPDDPETVCASGSTVPRRKGTLVLNLPVRNIGTADSNSIPLLWALASSMYDGGEPDSAGETVGANATAQTFEVADQADYLVGTLIAATLVGGRAEFAAIVEKADTDPDTVGHTPAFSSELDATPIRQCRTFVSKPGDPSSVLGPSLAFRLDGHRWRTYCFGCRLASIKMTGAGRRLMWSLTFDCAYIYDDHSAVSGLNGSNVDKVPFMTDGKIAHTLDCEVVVSNAIDEDAAAYPRVPGRTVLPVDEWSAEVNFELAPLTAWGSVLGMTDMEVTSSSATTATLSSPATGLTRDFLDRVRRNLMIGFGCGGAGNGVCLFMPGAYLTTDPNLRELGGPLVRQALTWTNGYWQDETSTVLSGTSVRIGFAQ